MTDAFAREVPHGQGGDFAATENRAREIPRDDASKLHAVLKHPEEINSGAVKSELRAHRPELVTLGGAVRGMVHEDDVGAVHPESNVKGSKKAWVIKFIGILFNSGSHR